MTKPTSIDQHAQDLAFASEMAEMAKEFETSWRECTHLTPRQAYAIALTLNLWADGDIDVWLENPTEKPLHEVRPFEYFDRRVMVHVRENRAWAKKASERCHAVSNDIQKGILPFDRPGAYFDELLMAAALAESAVHLSEWPESFERLLPRLASEVDDGGYSIGDDDWGQVSDHFDDICRFDEWEVPLYLNHPLLPAVLADRHPFTWFDVGLASGPGYLQRLKELAVEADLRRTSGSSSVKTRTAPTTSRSTAHESTRSSTRTSAASA